jgi:hypothetical protein
MSDASKKLAGSIFRVAIITFLATVISFAVSLFLAIVTILLVNMIRGGGVNMAHAYRHFAFPIAMVVMVISFITALRLEVIEARRQRTATRSLPRVA